MRCIQHRNLCNKISDSKEAVEEGGLTLNTFMYDGDYWGYYTNINTAMIQELF